jgi:hypothetical protein
MAAPLFFVPLALAGGKVFFKFATKKAAQAFKGKYAKAGSVTTKAPAKNAQVVTTGSSKGQSIIKDMTKPTTMPRVSPRNPNTKTLPQAPKKGSGAGAATATAVTGAGVAGSAKSTGDAEKPNKRKAPDRSADTASRQQSQFAKRGSIDAKKPKTALEVNIILGGGMNKKDAKKTSASPTSKPKNVPKRKSTVSPIPKPELTKIQKRLAEIDAENRKIAKQKIMAETKKNIDEAVRKKRIAKFLADAEAKAKKENKGKK